MSGLAAIVASDRGRRGAACLRREAPMGARGRPVRAPSMEAGTEAVKRAARAATDAVPTTYNPRMPLPFRPHGR